MILLLISGTPGTGKTSVSSIISEKLKAKTISLNQLVISEDLTSSYDKNRDTWIIDEEKIKKRISDLIQEYKSGATDILLIESHFSDIIPKHLVDLIIILRCEPETLIERLKERGYSRQKIRENVQSEILGNSINYFLEKNFREPLFEIDTTKLSKDELADEIIKIIEDKQYGIKYKHGNIDWLEKLFNNNQLMKYFD